MFCVTQFEEGSYRFWRESDQVIQNDISYELSGKRVRSESRI